MDCIAYIRARNKLEGLFIEGRTKEPKVKDEEESPEEKNRRALEEHQEKMRKRRYGS